MVVKIFMMMIFLIALQGRSSVVFLMEAFVIKMYRNLTMVRKNREFRLININIGAILKIPGREELFGFGGGKQTQEII